MKSDTENTTLPCDEQGSILKRTLALLQKDPRSHQLLSIETQVPLAWLTKLRNNEIPAPSINRVQYLYEKLSGKKL